MGPGIQQKERSSADYTSFLGARQIYNDTVSNFINFAPNTPKFKSNSDYVKWKRVTANLYSTVPANLPVVHTCGGDCGQ
jgi:hypothetical protein